MRTAYSALNDSVSAARCEQELRRLISRGAPPLPASVVAPSSKKKPAAPRISVALPTFNRKDVLRYCLAALAFQTLPESFWETVVVDDGSTDGTESLCRDLLLPYRLIYMRTDNHGAGSARRISVERAHGEFLLLCNDDTIASSTLLAEHLAFHLARPREHWGVLGEFRPSDGVVSSALSFFVNTSPFFFPQSSLQAGDVRDQAFFVTCNLSVHREAVLDVGNFDSTFRVAEDTELGTRLMRQGLRVIYHPAASAWHEHACFTAADLMRRARSYGRADWRLFQKHPQLLGIGASPFGSLSERDRRRMRAQVEEFGPAVTSGIAALEQLDAIDFRTVLADPAAAKELIEKVGKIAPMVYWHYLFEAFLEEWAAQEVPAPAESSVQAVTP
jgi:GT2 family glycosyltransferase